MRLKTVAVALFALVVLSIYWDSPLSGLINRGVYIAIGSSVGTTIPTTVGLPVPTSVFTNIRPDVPSTTPEIPPPKGLLFRILKGQYQLVKNRTRSNLSKDSMAFSFELDADENGLTRLEKNDRISFVISGEAVDFDLKTILGNGLAGHRIEIGSAEALSASRYLKLIANARDSLSVDRHESIDGLRARLKFTPKRGSQNARLIVRLNRGALDPAGNIDSLPLIPVNELVLKDATNKDNTPYLEISLVVLRGEQLFTGKTASRFSIVWLYDKKHDAIRSKAQIVK